MFSAKRRIIGGSVLLAIVAVAATFYWFVLPGLSSARSEPQGIEVAVATWLLDQSVPEELRARKNPLGSDPADVAAGRDLFRQKCELCHAYDGGGKTQIGGDEYPRPPPLRTAIASMSDGEVFYHIHNGIRNPADLATGCLYSRSAEGRFAGPGGGLHALRRSAGGALCGLGGLQEVSRSRLCQLEQIKNGERGARST